MTINFLGVIITKNFINAVKETDAEMLIQRVDGWCKSMRFDALLIPEWERRTRFSNRFRIAPLKANKWLQDIAIITGGTAANCRP